MAIGTPQPSIGPIDPSALIGQGAPVVEPRAVTALSDAFRSGFITADDIVQRAGEVGQLRKKAEIQSLTEATSPEAQAARAQAQQLQAAQNSAALPLVQPAADLAATQMAEQQAVAKYGPGVEYFKALAPEAAVSAPVLEDGTPDYAKRAQIGLQLFEWKQKREQARSRLKVADTKTSPDGTSLFQFNAQGEMLTDDLKKQLTESAVSPFATLQPGATAGVSGAAPTSAVAATTVPTATVPVELTNQQRAQAVEKFGVEPQNAATLTGTEFQGLVEPKVKPTSTSKPEVSPKQPGSSAFLGPAKAKDAPEKFVPGEGVKDIAMSRQAGDIAKRLQDRYSALVESEPNLVGFLQGRLATWAKSKEWNTKVAAFERDATAILAPIAKGTYNETGVLSEKDVERYKGVIPSLRDSPAVGNQKIQDLFNETRGALNNKINTWQRAGYDVSGFQDLITPGTTTNQSTQSLPPGASGGIMQLPSSGRKIVRDANGQYRLVQ